MFFQLYFIGITLLASLYYWNDFENSVDIVQVNDDFKHVIFAKRLNFIAIELIEEIYRLIRSFSKKNHQK